MESLTNIVLGLLTTLIGYALGRVWQRLADQVPRRQAKRLWGPVFAGEVQIVVSRFWPTGWPGPTGVVGGGDALALRELSSYFSKIGSQFDVVYVDEASLNRSGNLILLGGPDTNSVTKDALKSVSSNVRIFDPGPGISMELHDLAPGSSDGGAIRGRKPRVRKYRAQPDTTDYGVIIRARNPFNSAKALIIIAGAYGYGTWGGANLAMQDWFLKECQQLERNERGATRGSFLSYLRIARRRAEEFLGRPTTTWSQFECIFSVSIYDQRPHAPEIIALRPLS